MIRGLFLFYTSLIVLSSTQINLSWIENEPTILQNNSRELLVADHLTFEAAEHPGQLGDIRLLKEKTSKLRTTNIHFWFITERLANQFRFGLLSEQILGKTHKSSQVKHAGVVPLYLELNKIII